MVPNGRSVEEYIENGGLVDASMVESWRVRLQDLRDGVEALKSRVDGLLESIEDLYDDIAGECLD